MLQSFNHPRRDREQYGTDSEIASTALWHAYMRKLIEGKVVADLGCGVGVLGIGCLLLGAKKVYFVEIDELCVAGTKKNLEYLKKTYDLPGEYEVLYRDVGGFFENVDLVVQNPPFGTQQKHIDKEFLDKACSISKQVYSFHKTVTSGFVEAFARDKKFSVRERLDFAFPLKKTMKHHKKEVEKIAVSCFILESKV